MWWIIFIFPDPYHNSKHTNEVSLSICLKLSKTKKITWRKFLLILEMYILKIIFYHMLMKFVKGYKRKQLQEHPSSHSCHYQINVVGLPCLTYYSWHLWTEAEIIKKGLQLNPGICEQGLRFHPALLKRRFDMTFLEVLELQLFSICNKHI